MRGSRDLAGELVIKQKRFQLEILRTPLLAELLSRLKISR